MARYIAPLLLFVLLDPALSCSCDSVSRESTTDAPGVSESPEETCTSTCSGSFSTAGLMTLIPASSPDFYIGWIPPSSSLKDQHWSNFEPNALDGEELRGPYQINEMYFDVHEVSVEEYYSYLLSLPSYAPTTHIYNDSFVFLPIGEGVDQTNDPHYDRRFVDAPWWVMKVGAKWNDVFGQSAEKNNGGNKTTPTKPNLELMNHPVTHVSYLDASAYCSWRSTSDTLKYGPGQTRLPTEPEWEYASRGGKSNRVYPWGNKEIGSDGVYRANYFQGTFPNSNSKDDGFEFTSPRNTYPPQNNFNLYDMVGNVWEWTSTLGGEGRIKKGGSFLCHYTYCYRYRNSGRGSNSEDSTAGNLGFRCVRDVGGDEEGGKVE